MAPLLHEQGAAHARARPARLLARRPARAGAATTRPTRWSRDVAALVDAVGRPVHLVGHDWGAAVAWLVAARQPDLVRTLTAVSVPHPVAFLRAMVTSARGCGRWYMLLLPAARGCPSWPAGPHGGPTELGLRRGGHATRRGIARFRREIVADGALPGALGLVPRRPAGPLRRHRASQVGVPTTLVWSDGDVAIDRQGGRGLRRRGSTGPYRLEVLEGVSHWIPTQEPERLAGAVLRADRPSPRSEQRVTDRGRPAPAPRTEETSGEPPRPGAAAGARAAAAPGRRQPLPPRHRRRPDGAWLATDEALAAAAAVGVTRIVQIGCDLPGARWAVEAAARARRARRRRGAAPQRGARGSPRRARSRRRSPRSSALAAAQRPGARRRRDRARLLPHRGGGPGRPGASRSARHIDLAKRLDRTLVIHDRDAHDDVLRDPRRGGRARSAG